MVKHTVIAPTDYTGLVGADYFQRGRCDTVDAADLAYYERHGYTIEGATADIPREDDQAPGVSRPEDNAAKAEWVAVATTLGIDPEGKTKAELIADVDAALAGE